MTIRVVTDSTSDMPRDVADEFGISVIPQKVIFGDEELRDSIDISGDEFYRRVSSSPNLPTTSQASAGEFKDLYESIADGADGIVSVHVSGGAKRHCQFGALRRRAGGHRLRRGSRRLQDGRHGARA